MSRWILRAEQERPRDLRRPGALREALAHGANAVTKIKFSDAVTLGGKEIPAGEYALFTIPTADEWTIILSKDAKVQSTADYKQENDAVRLTAKPEPFPSQSRRSPSR